jgi:hypothetical protein
MINWKGFGRKRAWPNFKVLPDIRLEGMKKIFSQYSLSPGRDLNSGPLEYEAGGVYLTRK